MISASIVLYNNTAAYITKAIDSVLTSRLVSTVYIIDNSPVINYINHIGDSRVQYIRSTSNVGYGTAHNIAIAQSLQDSSTNYHLILNPDVEFASGVLEALYDYMQKNTEVGNVMPRIVYENGQLQKLCKLLPSPANLLGRRFCSSLSIMNKLNQKYELAFFNHDAIVDVPNLSGCFMFMRKETLRQAGGFDERFFMYMEDVDLNRRLNAIARTVFYPFVSIVHHHEKGSYKEKTLLWYHIKSAIQYFNKWGWAFDEEREKINSKTLKAIAELSKKQTSHALFIAETNKQVPATPTHHPHIVS